MWISATYVFCSTYSVKLVWLKTNVKDVSKFLTTSIRARVNVNYVLKYLTIAWNAIAKASVGSASKPASSMNGANANSVREHFSTV